MGFPFSLGTQGGFQPEVTPTLGLSVYAEVFSSQWRWSWSRELHSQVRPDSQGFICLTQCRYQSRKEVVLLRSHVTPASPMPQAQLSVELTSFVGSVGSPSTKIPQYYLNLMPQCWGLTLTHHIICFSNKTLQIDRAWRMLWLNLHWKYFRYNIDAM